MEPLYGRIAPQGVFYRRLDTTNHPPLSSLSSVPARAATPELPGGWDPMEWSPELRKYHCLPAKDVYESTRESMDFLRCPKFLGQDILVVVHTKTKLGRVVQTQEGLRFEYVRRGSQTALLDLGVVDLAVVETPNQTRRLLRVIDPMSPLFSQAVLRAAFISHSAGGGHTMVVFRLEDIQDGLLPYEVPLYSATLDQLACVGDKVWKPEEDDKVGKPEEGDLNARVQKVRDLFREDKNRSLYAKPLRGGIY